MSVTTGKITELAPDQASLNAASKLMKPAKWPVLRRQPNSDLIWGECQGSGANPYRTVFDGANDGYKCTCPSRKFPCKHVLALGWMYAEDPERFGDEQQPQWVIDWMGRRRNPGATGTKAKNSTPESQAKRPSSKGGKSLTAARIGEPEKQLDAKTLARRQAAAEKRASATRASISAGLDELTQWIDDQLRAGLAAFINEPQSRCRTIAARLVDAKAAAMASRLDELPARILQLPTENRLDALIQELSRIILISRAWKTTPDDAELTRLVGSSEKRDAVLENDAALRVVADWEVVGQQVTTRRDGLVSHATWLLNLTVPASDQPTQPFALLLDFVPASAGPRSTSFVAGDQFHAELVFYPARQPMRAVIAERRPVQPTPEDATDAPPPPRAWPSADATPLNTYRAAMQRAPWTWQLPLLLPAGQLARAGTTYWWQAANGGTALPIANPPSEHIASMPTQQSVALWDGMSLNMLSALSNWGRLTYDG